MNWIPFNVFQKVTRHWDEMHPYNAAQVMKLSGAADHARVLRAWRETLEELRLSRIDFSEERYRWRTCLPGEEPASLIEIPAGTSLDQFMSTELNRPFDESTGEPFRAFVIEQGESHFLGVVYHHWIADSYSIRLLLREWFLRLYDPAKARRKPFNAPEAGYRELFGPDAGGWSIKDSILTMIRWGTRFGRARRIGARKFGELESDFALFRGPDGLIDALSASARAAEVTMNDLFLAAMAMVCRELLPLDGTMWRRDLALGTIVDLRGRAGQKLRETFGLYLGFTTVFCRPEELANPGQLVRRVHRQIAMQKESHAAEASMMRLSGALLFKRLMSPEHLLETYRKRFGMTAGISNVNLNHDWLATYFPSPLEEYIRVSPCGPLMPVVFTPTTLGRSLDVGVTCRRSIIPAAGIHILAKRFMEHLEQFAAMDRME